MVTCKNSSIATRKGDEKQVSLNGGLDKNAKQIFVPLMQPVDLKILSISIMN